MSHNTIPTRNQVRPEDAWDLSSLYTSDDEWEKDFQRFKEMIPKIAELKGTLGESAEKLQTCLERQAEMGRLAERLGYYAFLRYSEDVGDGTSQERIGRITQAGTEAETAESYIAPEIQAIPEARMQSFLEADILADYRVSLKKLLRWKPHILSEPEERIMAMQEEANQTPQKSFGALTDADLDFGTVDTPEGSKPLSQSTLSSFLLNADRDVRKRAFLQFHEVFEHHKNTLANLYAGSVNIDIYKAKARNFDTSRQAALFPDDVPETVYDNLVQAVRDNLHTLHRYYELRRRVLGLEDFHLYDRMVPMVKDIEVHHTFEEAVDKVVTALEPLGEEYTRTIRGGLMDGWVDRYENKGKRSGAFSAGSYDGNPYILMNFKEDVLRDVFTLAHEGGHSMHSWYSARNNPFPHYNYTIFEAEVASTFNEQLLFKYFYDTTDDEAMRTYLLNKQVDDIIATLFRQTMFAEFEHRTHTMVEGGNPLTADNLRAEYRTLLEAYFGSKTEVDDVADMEGLRIPHFYRAFYVYKYATGLSAAITLAQRVLNGGETERRNYFNFLKSGGSRFPIESLKVAGVDMTSPEPVQSAMQVFRDKVDALEQALG
ncbi:MAG: oligoendopeptidase F [Spirochaetota bacterium]